MALAVSLPTGAISVAKFFLLVGTLGLCAVQALSTEPASPAARANAPSWTSWAVIAIVAVFAVSALWTTAPIDEAAHAWVKHGKLLVIPALLWLLRTRREAFIALCVFLGGQAFVLAASSLQGYAHVPLPFPTQASPGREFMVFAGHLDQPIMTSIAVAVAWHMRANLSLGTGRRFAGLVAVSLLGAVNVLVMQFGRTGHLVALTMMVAAVFWLIPPRYKLLAVLGPVLVAGAAVAGSSQVQHRMALVWQETASYEASGNMESSSGERLNYWRRSLQAIGERPLAGFGVGSWNMQYNRMEGGKGRFHTYQIRNPHQEFLLWTVELGIVGFLLLLGLFAAATRDARSLPTDARRAVISVLLAVGVTCLINSALYDAQIGDYLCVALGLTLAWGMAQSRDQGIPEASPLPVATPARSEAPAQS